MANYIYCPVLSEEMIELATDWRDERIARGASPYHIIGVEDSGNAKQLRRATGGGVLAKVAAVDKLYILTHGEANPGATGAVVVGNKRDGAAQSKYYTVKSLAKHLEAEQLFKEFVDLRLFVCNTTLTGANADRQIVAPFAARLKQEMLNLGYAAIVVSAYPGETRTKWGKVYEGNAYSGLQNAKVAKFGKGVRVNGGPFQSASKLRVVF